MFTHAKLARIKECSKMINLWSQIIEDLYLQNESPVLTNLNYWTKQLLEVTWDDVYN